MSETSTASVAPPLLPPLLEVGYNYTWPFNRYGTSIGPRDIHNNPPVGAGSAVLTGAAGSAIGTRGQTQIPVSSSIAARLLSISAT